MANEYENDVVRFFRRKARDGYEGITFIGAEQRYVNSLRNSGVNNLEEQYLFGTDTYTEIYIDSDGNTVTEKSFHVNSDDSSFIYDNYYKIVITDYKKPQTKFYFDEETFIIPDDRDTIVFGDGSADYPSLTTVYGVDSNIFNFNEDSFEVYIPEYTKIRQEKLLFVTNNGTLEKPVLTKIISKKHTKTGKAIYKEDIINHIAS